MRLAFGTPLLLLLHDESEASRAFPRRGMKSFWYLTTKHVAILGASPRKLKHELGASWCFHHPVIIHDQK
jgi:hypothetical protein